MDLVYVYDKGLLSKIRTEPFKLNYKKIKNSVKKNGPKTFADTSAKKTHKQT